MLDFDFELSDRIQKIQQIAKEYNLEQNGYIAFSGGKDSTVLHHIVDMALPKNKIPRVYSNTGLDFLALTSFVRQLAVTDERFSVIRPSQNIRQMLETFGYPFKSKFHAHICDIYSRQGKIGCVKKYAEPIKNTPHSCPQKLQFMFNAPLPFKISDKCCYKMKKEPFAKWEKENNRPIGLTGMRRAEEGLRGKINCLVFQKGGLHRFHPLAPCSDAFVDEFIKRFEIRLCCLYYPPYSFKRTGCVGCPFNIKLQEELNILEALLPNEYRKANFIWQKVYDFYRKINYRLKENEPCLKLL